MLLDFAVFLLTERVGGWACFIYILLDIVGSDRDLFFPGWGGGLLICYLLDFIFPSVITDGTCTLAMVTFCLILLAEQCLGGWGYVICFISFFHR